MNLRSTHVSAAAVCGIRERTQQQRSVIVLLPRIDFEIDGDRRIKRFNVPAGEIVAGSKGDPVYPGFQGFWAQIGHAAVVIGDSLGNLGTVAVLQGDRNSWSRRATRGIKDMGGNKTHENNPSRRSRAI